MRFIGITGGVGAGKSAILSYLAKMPDTKVLLADEIAHSLMQKGTACFDAICSEFAGEDILAEDGGFSKEKLSRTIFSNPDCRRRMNAIVHPAVKEYVKQQYAFEKEKGTLSLLVLEAALLIEEEYDAICDELWYIYTSEDVRRDRLKASRGYTDERIDAIFASQLSEEEFRKNTQVTIDNNGAIEQTFAQIEQALRRKSDE